MPFLPNSQNSSSRRRIFCYTHRVEKKKWNMTFVLILRSINFPPILMQRVFNLHGFDFCRKNIELSFRITHHPRNSKSCNLGSSKTYFQTEIPRTYSIMKIENRSNPIIGSPSHLIFAESNLIRYYTVCLKITEFYVSDFT